MIFSNEELSELRNSVSTRMKEARFIHTLGVERLARFLGEKLMPECVSELSAAAILHDVAKEIPYDEQIEFIKKSGIVLTNEDLQTKAVLHSFAGVGVIKSDFPHFATKNVLSSVFSHTVGAPDMSVFDTIIFISDFAEDGREYPSCKRIAENIKARFSASNTHEGYLRLLNITMLEVLEATVQTLQRLQRDVNSRTLLTINSFKAKI